LRFFKFGATQVGGTATTQQGRNAWFISTCHASRLWFTTGRQADIDWEILDALSGNTASGKSAKTVWTPRFFTKWVSTAIIKLRERGRGANDEKCAEQQSAEKVHSKPPWLHPPPKHVIRKIPPPK